MSSSSRNRRGSGPSSPGSRRGSANSGDGETPAGYRRLFAFDQANINNNHNEGNNNSNDANYSNTKNGAYQNKNSGQNGLAQAKFIDIVGTGGTASGSTETTANDTPLSNNLSLPLVVLPSESNGYHDASFSRSDAAITLTKQKQQDKQNEVAKESKEEEINTKTTKMQSSYDQEQEKQEKQKQHPDKYSSRNPIFATSTTAERKVPRQNSFLGNPDELLRQSNDSNSNGDEWRNFIDTESKQTPTSAANNDDNEYDSASPGADTVKVKIMASSTTITATKDGKQFNQHPSPVADPNLDHSSSGTPDTHEGGSSYLSNEGSRMSNPSPISDNDDDDESESGNNFIPSSLMNYISEEESKLTSLLSSLDAPMDRQKDRGDDGRGGGCVAEGGAGRTCSIKINDGEEQEMSQAQLHHPTTVDASDNSNDADTDNEQSVASHFSQEEYFMNINDNLHQDDDAAMVDLPPSSSETTSNNKRRPTRALSSASLVSLLKIKTIGEDDELNDDDDLLEDEDEDEISEFNDLDSGDGDNINDDGDSETDDLGLDISNKSDSRNKGDNTSASGGSGRKASKSFLPNHTVIEIQNPPDEKRRKSSPSDSDGGGDSDTFFMHSIKSVDDITHVSDAPDYDYNSISSSDQDEGAEGKGDDSRNGDADRKGSSRISQNDHVEEEKDQSKTKYISPMERKRSQDAIRRQRVLNNSEQSSDSLTNEVCGLLGLPKNQIRETHRGIMSRDTELKLRELAKKSERRNKNAGKSEPPKKEVQGSQGDGASNKIVLAEVDFSGKTAEPSLARARSSSFPTGSKLSSMTAKRTTASDSSASSSGSSDSSSEDLVFGSSKSDTSKTSKDWEQIRRQRLQKRLSDRSQRSSGITANTNGDDTKELEPAFSLDTTNHTTISVLSDPDEAREKRDTYTTARTHDRGTCSSSESSRQRLSRRKSDDDESSVCSSGTSRSKRISDLIAKRFPKLTFFNKGRASDDISEAEEMGDGENTVVDVPEEEDCTWERNILTEGEYYLAMSMLVYVHALLRETSMLGHTDIAFDEIDVNSFQSDVGFGGASTYLSKTKSSGFIIRVVMDELEKTDAFSECNRNENDMIVLREFKKWVAESRVSNIDTATDNIIKELRRKVARKRWKRAINAVRLMVRLGHSNSNNYTLVAAPNNQRRTKSDGYLRSSTTKAARVPRRALNESMIWLSDHKNQILSSLGVDDNLRSSLTDDTKRNTLVDQKEIKEIINNALEQPKFFREGSLLSNLIESGIEVVWFGDRHPNDVVYAITCNRKTKRVSVVFRGTVNAHNWLMNLKFAMTEHKNPIEADYPGREDHFGLHTGFSLYMTRQRKDDSLTKLEEIFSKIDAIGREISPDGNYELSITGHSLGGALATMCGFFAATSNTFSQLKTIRVFTFAAPRVGCQRFVYAVKYLERLGKLRLARFSNTRDIVPLIPFTSMDGFKVGRPYKHVGMHVRLHGTSTAAQFRLRRALDVTYPKNHGWLSEAWRGIWASPLINLNSIQGFNKCHSLSEHQTRIRFALEYRSALAHISFYDDKKRNRVKTLDEYYFIKGASAVASTPELTRVCLEDQLKYRERRRLRRIIIIVTVIALAEAVVLWNIVKSSIRCDSYPVVLYPLSPMLGCYEDPVVECSSDDFPFLLGSSDRDRTLITSQMAYSSPNNGDMDKVENSTLSGVNITALSVEVDENATSPVPMEYVPTEVHRHMWGCSNRTRSLWGVSTRRKPAPSSIVSTKSLSAQQIVWDTQLFLKRNDGLFHVEVSSIASMKLRSMIASRK